MNNEYRNPWKSLSERIAYENAWISIEEHEVLNPSGNEGLYGVVRFKNIAVAVIPLDADYNTWIVGQYRFPLSTFEWEVPEGGSPQTETTLATAKRELLEETGIRAKKWESILEMQLSNSTTDEVSVTFIAKDLTISSPNPDEDEEIFLKKLPFHELYQMVLKGEINDALSVASILKAKILMDQGKI